MYKILMVKCNELFNSMINIIKLNTKEFCNLPFKYNINCEGVINYFFQWLIS